MFPHMSQSMAAAPCAPMAGSAWDRQRWGVGQYKKGGLGFFFFPFFFPPCSRFGYDLAGWISALCSLVRCYRPRSGQSPDISRILLPDTTRRWERVTLWVFLLLSLSLSLYLNLYRKRLGSWRMGRRTDGYRVLDSTQLCCALCTHLFSALCSRPYET